MRKTLTKTWMLLAASVFVAGYTTAQTSGTTPATQTPASGAAPTAKAQSGTAASGSTPGTKTPAAKAPGAKTTARAPLTLKTEKDKQSYAIGSNIGTNVSKGMQKDGVDVDPAILARGFRDAMTGAKTLMTEEEIKTTLTALTAVLKKKQEELRKEQEEKTAALGAANKSEGETFLAANKAKEGVVTLPSGLQYKVLAQGTGPKPTAADTVVCNYKGTLLNGTEFDSSYKRGQPATFLVGQVIKGWTEALQLMPVGSKWQLFIPPDLAYGGHSAGPDIGPNSTLVFEVELLSIQPKPEPAPAPAAATPPAGSSPAAAPATTPPPQAKTAPKPAAPAPVTPPPTKP